MKPTEVIIEDLYTVLKKVSEEKQVDNPQIIDNFFSEELNPPSWPYLGLCQDQDNCKYTWHMGCEEIFLHSILDPIRREGMLTIRASMERKRNLKIMELYLRNSSHYVFHKS